MVIRLGKKISVYSFYNQGKVRPCFFWVRRQKKKVEKVNLIYSRREGSAKIYYFSVSTKTASYKLSYNSETLGWRLLEVYADDFAC